MIADLFGLEDRYAISDLGEIFAKAATRTRSDGVVRNFNQRKIQAQVNDCGYATVPLYNGAGSKSFKVHRLVLLSFDYTAGHAALDVNHKDGNKLNNCRTNLEWATRAENILHSYRELGRKGATTGKFGKAHHRAEKIVASLGGILIHEFDSMMDAQRAGFSAGHISRCVAGKAISHKGLVWTKPS